MRLIAATPAICEGNRSSTGWAGVSSVGQLSMEPSNLQPSTLGQLVLSVLHP